MPHLLHTPYHAEPRFAGRLSLKGKRVLASATLASTLLGSGANIGQNIASGSCRPLWSPVQISQTVSADEFVPVSGDLPATADSVLKELQKHQSLHATESAGRWKYFKKNDVFTAADFDVRVDARGKLIVAHDNPDYFLGSSFTLNRLSFINTLESRLKDIEKLPPGKVAVLKLDVKTAKSYEPLVRLLKKYAPLFENRILIINGGYDFHSPQTDPKVAAAKEIKKAIPNVVFSIDAGENDESELKPGLRRVMDQLGPGIYTLPVMNGQAITTELLDWMSDNNMFVTLWAKDVGLTCSLHPKNGVADEYRTHLPVTYHNRFWAEF